jgi:hypothetical protein
MRIKFGLSWEGGKNITFAGFLDPWIRPIHTGKNALFKFCCTVVLNEGDKAWDRE